MTKTKKRIKMTKEDREYFKQGMKTANPVEFLIIADFLNEAKEIFTEADLKFMHSCAGKRAERLLRNVVENLSFEDKSDTTGGEFL